MWFRRRRRRRPEAVQRPFDLGALPEPELVSLEDATDEGLLLAEYASRMSVKNSVVIGALRGTEPYSEARYIDTARESLEALATEAEEVADRIADTRELTAALRGEAGHVHDYRPADMDNLELREDASRSMARVLRERCDDEEYLSRLVLRARDDAWDEIAKSIEAALHRGYMPEATDEHYARDRAKRIKRLISEDLAALTR